MSLYQTVTSLYKEVTDLVYSQLAGNIVNLTNAIKPFFLSFLGVYIAFIFYQAVTQQKEGFFSEFISKIASWCFVSAVLFTSGLYKDYCMPFIWDIGDHLSSFVLNNQATGNSAMDGLTNIIQAIEGILDSYMDEYLEIKSTAFGEIFLFIFKYALVVVATSVFAIYCLAYLLMSKIFLGIVLSLAPIFICFVVFPTTRGMFNSWLSACFSFSLVSVAYVLVFQIFDIYTRKAQYIFGMKNYLSLMLMLLICVYLMGQIGGVISSLTGGASFNGLSQSMRSGMGILGGLAGTTGKVGKKVGKKVGGYAINKSTDFVEQFKNRNKGNIGDGRK